MGTAYVQEETLHESGKYGLSMAETEAFSVSRGSFSLRSTHYFNDIWHEKIISQNLRVALVENVNYGVVLAELIKEGNTGFERALSNFELEGGSRFSAYAARCIRHNIVRAIMNQPVTRRAPCVTKASPPQKIAESNIHRQQMG